MFFVGVCCACSSNRGLTASFTTASSISASPTAISRQPLSDYDIETWQAALRNLQKLIGMYPDDAIPGNDSDLGAMLARLKDQRLSTLSGDALAQVVFNDLKLQKTGASIADFLGLAEIIWSELDPSLHASHSLDYEHNVQSLQSARMTVDQFVLKLHPGLSPLRISKLRQVASGRGIVIGVFDVFDDNLLSKQRRIFKSATIEPLQRLGDPPSLDHGNAVIDTILMVAPSVRIVPISADALHYTAGFSALSSRGEISIINMSRGFAAAANDSLDSAFTLQLQKALQRKVITKAIGNTGTDLKNNVTAKRRAANLGPARSLAAYDLALIRKALTALNADAAHPSSQNQLLLAVSLSPFADQIALSATVPGDYASGQKHSFGLPADGVYSRSSSGFVSGSSFAAPLLAGLVALLLDAAHQAHPDEDPICQQHAAIDALQTTADPMGMPPSEVGHGVPHGDAAFEIMKSCLQQ